MLIKSYKLIYDIGNTYRIIKLVILGFTQETTYKSYI